MKYLTSPLELLTADEMRLIHDKTVELLETTGIYIDHDGFLDALEAKGARIDRSTRVAKLPVNLTERAARDMAEYPCLLKDFPQAVADAEAARIKAALQVPLEFYFGGSALEIVAADCRTTRPAGYEDLQRTVRFGNGHPRIKYVGGPPVLFSYDADGRELPPGVRRIAGMAYMAKHSAKFGWNGIDSPADVAFAVKLGELLAGSEEAYRRDPFFLCCRCSVSPLKIGRSSADTLYKLALGSLPVILAPMPLAGGTTPVTTAATILIANAEALGFMTALWAVGSELSRSSHGNWILSGILDMQTTMASFAAPSARLQDAGFAQLRTRFYGTQCVSFSDFSDAKYPGYQSGLERGMMITALAACGQIRPSVGQLKQGLVCSLEQACLDVEAYDNMHHFMKGIEVSNDSLCSDLIREQGIGGHFLDTDHTLRHFREEFFLPKLADRTSGVGRDMLEAAREEVDEILENTPRFSREEALCNEIDRLYNEEVERRNT